MGLRACRLQSIVLGLVVSGVLSCLGAATARAYVFRVTVGRTPVGRAIPKNFLGLALEYNEIPELAGGTPASVNPVFAQLLRNLDPSGRPVIRVGGQSTDRTWWPVAGMSRPIGVTYGLTKSWVADAQALARSTGARYLLGINLESNRTRVAQVEGANLVKGLGGADINALEIGNEPDLYPLIPWYKLQNGHILPWYDRAGTPVFSRRPTYNPESFLQEFDRTVRVLPRLALAGPETGTYPWLTVFTGLLSPRSQLRTLTSHAYGLNDCVTEPSSPQYPSVAHLLSLSASRTLLNGLDADIGLAHRDGGSYRVDEMGSISCNGRLGVSNTLASALWLTDSLFDIASQGVDGVNLHTYPNSANGLFDFTTVRGVDEGEVHPLYYGALMFAQAAPAGSRLLAVSSAAQTNLRAWATMGSDHHTRVLLINDSLTSSATVLVHAAQAGGTAGVEALSARSAYATSGVSLGGMTFGTGTRTGVLPAPVAHTITARGGTFTVSVAPGSAALLQMPPAAPAAG